MHQQFAHIECPKCGESVAISGAVIAEHQAPNGRICSIGKVVNKRAKKKRSVWTLRGGLPGLKK